MEDIFITKIDIEKSRNLENVSIPLSETERKHLILTGRNGSGKTSLLNLLFRPIFMQYQWSAVDLDGTENFNLHSRDESNQKLKIKLNCAVKKARGLISLFFEASRNTNMSKPNKIEQIQPDKYVYNGITLSKYSEKFLQFLVNQKADRSFANDDGEIEIVKQIDNWFQRFELQLKKIFETDKLQLKFRGRHDYSFDILIPGREPFGFEALSDGYSSIIDIVGELIMRMEKGNRDLTIYDMQGIVLIDEIESHLHVSLQKIILPFLIEFFPKIQFIVSTHSPFVLSSISNAVIFDLENKTVIEDLSQYSYDAIIESYFDSDKYSEIIKEKMEEYDQLSLIENKTPEQIHQFRQLKDYFAHAPKYLAKELFVKLQEIELRSVKSKTAVD